MALLVFGGSKHDVWLSAIISVIMGLMGCYVILTLALRYPAQTLIQYSQQIVGTWLGKILGLIYICFFIMSAAVAVRDFSELILNYTIDQVPLSVFIAVMIVMAAYAIFKGLSTIGRLAELIVPITFLAIIFGLLGNIPNAVFLPSFPLIHDLKYLISEAMLQLPYFGLCVSLLFLIPMLHEKTGAKKTLLWSFAIAGAVAISVAVIVVAVLGPYGTVAINYPFFLTFQQITFLPSVSRFDVLFIFVWISISFITITLSYFIALTSIQQLFKTKTYRKFIIPLGLVIAFIAVYAFPSFHHFKQFLRLERFGLIAIPLEFIIPSIILVISYFKQTHRHQSRGRVHG
jgi:spore germination protein KB